MVNDSGDSALTVANSPRMKRMIKGESKDSLDHVCMFSMEYSETSNNDIIPLSVKIDLYVKRLLCFSIKKTSSNEILTISTLQDLSYHQYRCIFSYFIKCAVEVLDSDGFYAR